MDVETRGCRAETNKQMQKVHARILYPDILAFSKIKVPLFS